MPLAALPSEVLLLIFSGVPFSANVALRATCRRLRTLSEQLILPAPTMQDFLFMETWPEFCASSVEQHLCYACSAGDDAYQTPIQLTLGNQQGLEMPQGQDLFACFICLRLKPASCFKGDMVTGLRAKQAINGQLCTRDPRRQRCCVDCAARVGGLWPEVAA